MKIIALLSLFISSCTISPRIPVELVVPESHPFEDAFAKDMWYTLTYFDGRGIIDLHVPVGTRRMRVYVRSGALSVFALSPLGELGELGGFFEPGSSRIVRMLPEHGAFAAMLLRAASYRPEPVAMLSMEAVLAEVPDLQAVDEPSFMEDIFDGTLSYGITLNEKIHINLDSLPEGEWIPERFDVLPISVPFSGHWIDLMLYPGVYRYAEVDRKLLLTIIVSEDGEASSIITAVPMW